MTMNRPEDRLRCSPWRAGALLALLAAVSACSAQDLPVPRNHVDDRARVISQSFEQQLIAILAELERKTGVQMIVLTVNTTGGVPIGDYALRLSERWQLGQKGKDNGALIVVAVKDRKYRFEIGYGLEGILPDSYCGTIGRRYFQPHFRQGNYSEGIYGGVIVLVQRVAKAEDVSIAGAMAAPPPPAGRQYGQRTARSDRRGYAFCSLLPLILVFIMLNVLFRRGRAYRRWGYGHSGSWLTWLLLGSMLGGGRRHYGGGFGGGGFGGGFGGFGGGSFGGGGGGSFGGGGASGGW